MLNMAKSDGEKIYYINLSTPIPVETSCLYVCSPKRGLQMLNGEVKPNKKNPNPQLLCQKCTHCNNLCLANEIHAVCQTFCPPILIYTVCVYLLLMHSSGSR